MDSGDLASEFSAAAKLEGQIVVLELTAGDHPASLVVDGNFNASELRIESAGGAELRAVGDAPLLKVLPGAPPVRLVGLTLHGAVEVEGSELRVSNCTWRGSGASNDEGGALRVSDGSALVEASLIEGFRSTGGAIAVDGGSLVLANGTLLKDNAADGSHSAVLSKPGSIHYVLAAPPGRYVSKTGVATCDGDAACPFAPWPELLGRAVQALATGLLSDDFPYACAGGTFGRADAPEVEQSGPSCSGRCPAGKQCPVATVEPLPCGLGGYCAAGSSQATPCPGGTYGNSTSLKAEGECTKVGPGFHSSLGSAKPEVCPVDGCREGRDGGTFACCFCVLGRLVSGW